MRGMVICQALLQPYGPTLSKENAPNLEQSFLFNHQNPRATRHIPWGNALLALASAREIKETARYANPRPAYSSFPLTLAPLLV